MRKYFIDNLRTIAIVTLFPYHTAMIWNNFGDEFYILAGANTPISGFITFLSPLFMPLLFTLAGISTRYALHKRTPKQYIKDRIMRLLLPCVFGILLLVPIQTYFAEKFHGGFTGDKIFAHLWFLAYLFVISLIALGIAMLMRKIDLKISTDKRHIAGIVLLFVPVWLMTPILEFGGKSIGKYFILFLLGFYVLSNDNVQNNLDKLRYYLLCGFLVCNIAHMSLWYWQGISSGFWYNGLVTLTGFIGILAVMGLSKHSLDFSNRTTAYFAAASFSIYILHQTWLVAIAYFVIRGLIVSVPLQFAIIMFGSFIATMISYEIVKRIPIVRGLLGIRIERMCNKRNRDCR